MNKLEVIVCIVAVVVLALTIISLKYWWIWIANKRRYLHIQAGRVAMTDEGFCTRLGLELSDVSVVSVIRSKLAARGRYDRLRVYPEDTFWPHFALDYDDDVAMFVQEIKVIDGYEDYSFPLEDVKSVGDFIKVVLRMRKASESTKRQTIQ